MEKFTDLQDFLSNESFIQWVLNGRASEFWDNFLDKHPEKKVLFEEAKNMALRLQEAESSQDLPLNQDKIWNRIESEISILHENPRWNSWVLKIAALVLLVLDYKTKNGARKNHLFWISQIFWNA